MPAHTRGNVTKRRQLLKKTTLRQRRRGCVQKIRALLDDVRCNAMRERLLCKYGSYDNFCVQWWPLIELHVNFPDRFGGELLASMLPMLRIRVMVIRWMRSFDPRLCVLCGWVHGDGACVQDDGL